MTIKKDYFFAFTMKHDSAMRFVHAVKALTWSDAVASLLNNLGDNVTVECSPIPEAEAAREKFQAMMARRRRFERWQCLCGDMHQDEDSARNCMGCAPDVFECWICPACEGRFDTLDEAEECFEKHDEDSARLEELEVLGQARFDW